MNIGKKIKRLRILYGLTQQELADRCEVTKGFISQLENNLTSPTISTLNDILVTLGTNLGDFFMEKDAFEKIVFSTDDYFISERDSETITWLVPNAQKNEMEPVIIQLEPHSETTVDMPHEGQEFGYVLEGKILLIVSGIEHPVKKGETFYFTTDKTHYLKNTTSKVSKILWISSPPNF